MSEKRYPQTILATACIPWTEGFSFDETAFRQEVRDLIKRGIINIYLYGTAGEGYAITDEQFETITGVFADEMKGDDLYPMVGLISLSMPIMLERLRKAYNLGIRDFQFSLPSWSVLTDRELNSFVHQLCDSYPDCRFLHYNLMRTKRILGIQEYEKLAKEVPNLVGVKYSTTDISIILDIAASDCPLRFFLTENGFGYASMVGDFGFLISLATSNLKRAWEYFNAAVNGEKDKVLTMQYELNCMQKELMRINGTSMIDGAYDKIFCKVINDDFSLRLLPPYECTSDENYARYYKFLEKHLPQWIEKIVKA